MAKLLIKRKFIVDIIAGLFILLFLYTALSKLSDQSGFTSALSKSPLIGKVASIIAWLLPSVELLVACLLFIPKTQRLGLLSSLILMIGFTGYLSYMILETPNLPCTCGGVLQTLTWNQHLVFNIAFTILGILGVVLSKNKTRPNKISPDLNYSPA